MALLAIKTASVTGYCDCICGCYELASLRDDDTGKGYCPRCAKEHLEMNQGVGLPQPAPSKLTSTSAPPAVMPLIPAPADPDRKSTRLNSSHRCISYAVFCLKKKTKK